MHKVFVCGSLCMSDIVPSPWYLVHCQGCPLTKILQIAERRPEWKCSSQSPQAIFLMMSCLLWKIAHIKWVRLKKDPWFSQLFLLYQLPNPPLHYICKAFGINRRCRRFILIQSECPVHLLIMDYTEESKFQMSNAERTKAIPLVKLAETLSVVVCVTGFLFTCCSEQLRWSRLSD